MMIRDSTAVFFQKGSSTPPLKFSDLRYSLCQFRVVRCLSCLGQGPEVEGDGSESCGGFGIVGACSYVRISLLYCAFVQLEVSWDHFWKWAAPRRLGWQGRAAVRLCQAPQWEVSSVTFQNSICHSLPNDHQVPIQINSFEFGERM